MVGIIEVFRELMNGWDVGVVGFGVFLDGFQGVYIPKQPRKGGV